MERILNVYYYDDGTTSEEMGRSIVTATTGDSTMAIACVQIINTSCQLGHAAPLPPPDRMYLSNADLNSRVLTFEWSPVTPDCSAIHYNILASNCGSCPTTTNHTTVTYTDVPTNGNSCTFALQTVVCGHIVHWEHKRNNQRNNNRATMLVTI